MSTSPPSHPVFSHVHPSNHGSAVSAPASTALPVAPSSTGAGVAPTSQGPRRSGSRESMPKLTLEGCSAGSPGFYWQGRPARQRRGHAHRPLNFSPLPANPPSRLNLGVGGDQDDEENGDLDRRLEFDVDVRGGEGEDDDVQLKEELESGEFRIRESGFRPGPDGDVSLTQLVWSTTDEGEGEGAVSTMLKKRRRRKRKHIRSVLHSEDDLF